VIVPKAMRGAIFLIVMLLGANAWAVTSSLWEEDTKKAFDSGQPEGISVMEPGKIVLGPSATITTLDAHYGWSLVEDSKGRVYTGTGNDGKIFRVSHDGKSEVFADLELQQIFTLAIDKRDTIYAAGFPGGKIYSINVSGEISEYYDTEQNSVWSLYLGVDGTLFAATGDKGEIFSVKSSGKGQVLYDSPQRIILSLLGDSEGNIYAGAGEGGIIYKIDKNGHAGVFYNTDLDEVRSMTMDFEGNLYAVSSPGDLFAKIPPPQSAPQTSKPPEEGGIASAIAAMAVAAQTAAPPAPIPGMPAIPSPKKRTCIVYKIEKNGAASKFWVSPEVLIFSIVFDGSNLLAGSGDDGIIYVISPTGEEGTYYEAKQKQVLTLHRSKNGAIIASLGNDAAVIRFGSGYASSGVFISQVHDATALSHWGRVFWEADVPPQTSVSLATRSGNSGSPDDTWSKWSQERAGKEGFISESPSARYIQWKATLSTSNSQETPTLRKVTVAYIQTNLPPDVQSVTVGAGATAKKDGVPVAELAAALKAISGAAALGAPQQEAENVKVSAGEVKAVPSTHETKLKIQWQAKDPNDDTLQYTVYFKGTGETRWLLLKDKLNDTNYQWDTEAVPDGEYRIKVLASDEPSNPIDTALKGERVSDGFMIDNTPPVVKALKAVRQKSGSYQISATVSDNLSPVSSAQYSIDAGDWQTVFPVDGIFDSLVEQVEFTTGKLEKGEHTIALKANDYFGNIGAGKITFVAQYSPSTTTP
jgi:hypothetical protein